MERLVGHHVIAVNNSYIRAPFAEAMFFGDERWLNIAPKTADGTPGPTHRELLRGFGGLKITVREELFDEPGIHVVRRYTSQHGISQDQGTLVWNRNSGGCAINLAFHLGARKIVLLGYDMRKVDGQHNYHTDHPKEDNPDPNYNVYEDQFIRPFESIMSDARKFGLEIVNATPGSALKWVPIVDPVDVMPILPNDGSYVCGLGMFASSVIEAARNMETP